MSKLRNALFALAATLSASAASATAVPTDTWLEFGFDGAGSALESGIGFVPLVNPAAVQVGDPAWTFTLIRPGTLFVTDAFISGDQFELFNFGAFLGQTSLPVGGSSCGSDLGCALADPNFSSASFALAPGNYSITGAALLSPFGGGAGAFIVRTSEIPVPAGLALLPMALAGLVAVGRRRKRAA
ncbi:hypothetical protein [Pseudooceanicola sp. LIPI14-2-Ac024]|uniref:hypothetical protein n=1 Tax=Pseudooceanicola sp. LIPI14-2-Ac024 TaxID=3344875 RepID=UPI0035CF421D